MSTLRRELGKCKLLPQELLLADLALRATNSLRSGIAVDRLDLAPQLLVSRRNAFSVILRFAGRVSFQAKVRVFLHRGGLMQSCGCGSFAGFGPALS